MIFPEIPILLCILAVYFNSGGYAAAIGPSGISLIQLSSNSSHTVLPNLAASVNANGLNPHFSGRVTVGSNRLDSMSLMMNGVEALASLAIRVQASLIPAARFSTPDYPTIALDIYPAQASRIATEVVLECLFYGLSQVIMEEKFFETRVECQWDHELVATARFHALAPTAGHVSRSDEAASLSSPPAVDNATLASVNPVFLVRPDSETLSITNVFLMAYIVFHGLAPLPSDHRVGNLLHVSGPPTADPEIYMLFDTEIPEQPPFFDVGVAIETVRVMPRFMLANRRWCTVSIAFIVDGVHVGSGLLGTGDPDQ